MLHAHASCVFYLVSVLSGALNCDWFGHAVVVLLLFVAYLVMQLLFSYCLLHYCFVVLVIFCFLLFFNSTFYNIKFVAELFL